MMIEKEQFIELVSVLGRIATALESTDTRRLRGLPTLPGHLSMTEVGTDG